MDALVAARYLEQRIADHVTAGRLQHAADLMYADGVRGSLILERAANAAFTAHAQDLQFGRTRVQWTEGALLALSAAIGFVLALLVMPARQAQAAGGAAKRWMAPPPNAGRVTWIAGARERREREQDEDGGDSRSARRTRDTGPRPRVRRALRAAGRHGGGRGAEAGRSCRTAA